MIHAGNCAVAMTVTKRPPMTAQATQPSPTRAMHAWIASACELRPTPCCAAAPAVELLHAQHAQHTHERTGWTVECPSCVHRVSIVQPSPGATAAAGAVCKALRRPHEARAPHMHGACVAHTHTCMGHGAHASCSHTCMGLSVAAASALTCQQRGDLGALPSASACHCQR